MGLGQCWLLRLSWKDGGREPHHLHLGPLGYVITGIRYATRHVLGINADQLQDLAERWCLHIVRGLDGFNFKYFWFSIHMAGISQQLTCIFHGVPPQATVVDMDRLASAAEVDKLLGETSGLRASQGREEILFPTDGQHFRGWWNSNYWVPRLEDLQKFSVSTCSTVQDSFPWNGLKW